MQTRKIFDGDAEIVPLIEAVFMLLTGRRYPASVLHRYMMRIRRGAKRAARSREKHVFYLLAGGPEHGGSSRRKVRRAWQGVFSPARKPEPREPFQQRWDEIELAADRLLNAIQRGDLIATGMPDDKGSRELLPRELLRTKLYVDVNYWTIRPEILEDRGGNFGAEESIYRSVTVQFSEFVAALPQLMVRPAAHVASSPAGPRRRQRPQGDKVAAAVSRKFPDGVPQPSELSNQDLLKALEGEIKGFSASDRTILRICGRMS